MKIWPFNLLTPYFYSVILADPPWQFEAYSGGTVPQRAEEQHYQTMTLDQMAELPVKDLAAPNCALAMWVISSHLPQALELGKAWGFEYSSKCFAWSKLCKFHGNPDPDPRKARKITDNAHWAMMMGHTTRKNTEDCLLFTRGRPKRVDKGVRELIVAPVGRHSQKPDEQYERLERLYGDVPRCELFSRRNRAGWHSWGNEVGKFDR